MDAMVALNFACALANWTFFVVEAGNGAIGRAGISGIVAIFNTIVTVRLWMELD